MKAILIASLVAAQTFATASPAFAASLYDQHQTTQQSRGIFAGARLRIALGGGEKPVPRAGLALASTLRSERSDGRSNLRFADGVELGFAGSAKPRLMLAGQRVGSHKLGAAEGTEKEKGKGPSTLGTIGIIAGGLLVLGGIGFAILMHEAEKASE